MLIVCNSELPHAAQFIGRDHGGVGISFFIVDAGPGDGPKLHQHEYEEIFVVQEGAVMVTAGDETQEVHGGEIVVIPPRTPHKFINHTTRNAKMLNLHASPEMVTEWLE